MSNSLKSISKLGIIMTTRLEEVTEKINVLVEKVKNGAATEEEVKALSQLNEELNSLQTEGKSVLLG